MNFKDVYEFVVKEGINADPRGRAKVSKNLAKIKKDYQKLNKTQQAEFDQERLWNPYGDTRILFGNLTQRIKKILVGIDIEGPELLLIDQLNKKGKKIDLAMSHHPEGVALAGLPEVMDIHSEVLKDAGVSISVAESLMAERIAEVKRRVSPANHMRSVDVARLLGIPFMSAHTVADNHVAAYLDALMKRKKPDTLGDVVSILKSIPEYADAVKHKAGPKIIVGDAKRQVGKIFIDMTGGTSGSKDAFSKLAQAGIGTIIGMHLSEEHFRKVSAERINVIIAGHMASDSLGLNLLLDKLQKKSKIDIVECSGFRRIKRK